MRAFERCILFGCLVAAALTARAQDTRESPQRKPGLYDLTVTTVTVSPSPSSGAARTRQVCLTQEMIDKYGAIVPDNLTNICQLTNIVKRSGGMSAGIACSGPLVGQGTLQVNWADPEHAKGTIHFSGVMHPGDKDIKIEWTAETDSVYKGPDCGALKPAPPAPTPPASSP